MSLTERWSASGTLTTVIGADDPGERWDAFVAAHPNGHVMQSRAWACVWRDLGWRALFLRLEEEGSIRGGALLLRCGIPATGLGLLYIPRGPVLDFGDPGLQDAFASSLRQLARDQRAFLVQADPAIPAPCPAADAAMNRLGFRLVEKQGLLRIGQPLRVMRIPLDRHGGPDRLLAALPQKTRYNIGLARRKGVVIVPRADHDAARLFHGMLKTAGQRKGYAVRGFRYHEAIWRHAVQAGLGEYLFADHEGRTLAAAQILRFGKTAWYMYGASVDEDRHLMPTYLLQWEAIRRAWMAGCTCYDLRGVYSPDPKPEDPEYGVYDFKRKLNAELVSFIGEFDFVVQPRIHAAWRFLERLVQGPAGWALRLRSRLARVR